MARKPDWSQRNSTRMQTNNKIHNSAKFQPCYSHRNWKRCLMPSPETKTPGPDGITIELLKNCPKIIHTYIITISNAVIRLNAFPQTWKEVILIHKPRHEPSSKLPIHLLSSISKITERKIQTRLIQILTQISIIPIIQFNFQCSHWTGVHMIRIDEDILNGFNQNQSTGKCLI